MASGLTISVTADVKAVSARLDALARTQIPFAASLALNDVAFQVQKAEQAAIATIFKNPRPFTKRSVLVSKASKSSLTATVYVREEVAKYLAPYEFGGTHQLPSNTLLNPKNIRLDQYGQLTKGTTARLNANPKDFYGSVHGVRGYWQRMKNHHLKLLLRMGDAVDVKQRLGFYARGEAIVRTQFAPALRNAIERALSTIR